MSPKVLRPLLLALCLGLSACAMPQSYLSGQQAMAKEEFPRAVEYFEAALREKPDNPEIKAAVTDARRQAARLYYQRAMQRPEGDLWSRFDDLDAALSFERQDPDLQKALSEVESRQGELQDQVDLAFQQLNADQAAKALETYRPVQRFEAYSAPLTAAGKVVIRQYCHTEGDAGMTDLANLRAVDARRHFEEVLKYDPQNTRSKAALRSIDGLSRLESRDFEAALNFFRESVSIDSGFDFGRERLHLARRGMLTALLRDGAVGLDRAETPAAIVKLMDLNAAALTQADETDPERNIAAERLKSLRLKMGNYFLQTATDALSRTPPAPATAVAAFRAAHLVSPDQAQPSELNAAKALTQFYDQRKLNVVVHFETDKGDDYLSSFLHEGVVAALDAAALPGLNLVTREHLKDLVLDEESLAQGFSNKKSVGVDLETADLIIVGKVVKHKVNETGAERPITKRSTYVSGVRPIKNPDYGEAEAALHQAEAELENAKRSAATASSSAEGIGTALSFIPGLGAAKDIGKIAGSASGIAATAAVNSAQRTVSAAQQKMDQMPKTIDQDVVSSYAYKEYNVVVDVDLRVSIRLVDRRTSLTHKAEVVQAKDHKTGLSRENVEPTDKAGLVNLDGPLPDKEEVRTQVQNELGVSLSKKVIELLGAFRRNRWAQAAKSAQTRRQIWEQLEATLMFLDLVTDDDEVSAKFEEFAFETAGLSRGNRKLTKYRAASIADNDVWPSGAVESATQ